MADVLTLIFFQFRCAWCLIEVLRTVFTRNREQRAKSPNFQRASRDVSIRANETAVLVAVADQQEATIKLRLASKHIHCVAVRRGFEYSTPATEPVENLAERCFLAR